MKITYLTHASLLIEAGGKRILTDPWLVGPSWGGVYGIFQHIILRQKNYQRRILFIFSWS